MLRKKYLWKLLALIMVLSLITVGCGKKTEGDTAWSYEKKIQNPLKATSGSSEITLGNIETNGVEVTIPGNAFATPTEVSLVNPDQVPKYLGSQMIGFGAPIELSVGEKPVRLLQPVTIKMKYDPTTLGDDLESGALYMGYYNEKEWQYVKPQVDKKAHIMTFTTSHFSLFGQAKITVDQRIEQYTKNAALASWAQDQTNSITDEALERVIDHVLKDKLKINDEAMKGQIISSIIKDDEWGGMLESIAGGDPEQFNQNLQVLVGKKIVDNVPASKLSSALGSITGDIGIATVAKASEAAGYLAEGRAKDAAKIIGEHIADQFMITTVGKIAVAAVDNQIQSWKSEEVEAAYQAYKNGASSKVPWWGYQVEKNNFDDVWSQMGGAARQLEIEAITAQEKVRKDAGMPALTDQEKEKLRTMVHKDLKTQFEQRVKTDAEIEKKKAEFDMIMDMYKSSGFMEKGRWGWEKGYELEQRLDILVHFKDKLLKDTGRAFIKSGTGHNEEGISVDELKTIAMSWFSTTDPAERQKNYVEYLKKEFGIVIAPNADLLNGQWSSASITIEEYDLGPAPEAVEKTEGEKQGCDLTELDVYNSIKATLEKDKGKPIAMKMGIQLDATGVGNLTITDEDGEKTNFATTYKEGIVTAAISEDGSTAAISGTVSEAGSEISISGTFRVQIPMNSSNAWIKGTWKAKK